MKKFKHNLILAITYLSGILISLVLIFIVAFVFINGSSNLTWSFLTSPSGEVVEYIEITGEQFSELSYQYDLDTQTLTVTENSPFKAETLSGRTTNIPKGAYIEEINDTSVDALTETDLNNFTESSIVSLKIVELGGGIMPMIVTTIYIILLSLIIALPLGIGSAIYLVEYSNQRGRLNQFVHSAIDNLAGIPSIIYGLFGMVFFVVFLDFGYSLLAGSLTLTIMLMPVIIRTVEEALKSVPNSLREGARGLGATKLETIYKVVLPSAMGGILVAVILSIGRVIGESAILLFTAGTIGKVPTSIYDSGATLTVQAYLYAKENGDIQTAASIGIVIIFIIVILNLMTKLITNKMSRG